MMGVGRQAIAGPKFAPKIVEGRIGEIKWCITCQECTMLLGANQRVVGPICQQKYRALLPKKKQAEDRRFLLDPDIALPLF